MIPAFETQQYRPEMPYDKEELKKFVDTGQVQIFRSAHGSNSLTTRIVSIGHVEDYPIMHYFGIPRTTQSVALIQDFLKFLRVPVQNHIVRMLNSTWQYV